jgi:hypothetical protein
VDSYFRGQPLKSADICRSKGHAGQTVWSALALLIYKWLEVLLYVGGPDVAPGTVQNDDSSRFLGYNTNVSVPVNRHSVSFYQARSLSGRYILSG